MENDPIDEAGSCIIALLISAAVCTVPYFIIKWFLEV